MDCSLEACSLEAYRTSSAAVSGSFTESTDICATIIAACVLLCHNKNWKRDERERRERGGRGRQAKTKSQKTK